MIFYHIGLLYHRNAKKYIRRVIIVTMVKWIAQRTWFPYATERLIPVITWLLITFPLWFSPFHPAVVAYFIIAFDLYFFYRAINTVINATKAYQRITVGYKINFNRKIDKNPKINEINHFIIIPNYLESLEKLKTTISAIIANQYPGNKLYLVMAFEKQEEAAKEKFKIINNLYRTKFSKIFDTYHQLSANEVPGKASNQTWAAKQISAYVRENQLDPQQILITICDADSQLPKNYFSYLTYEFLIDKEHIYHFYWAPVFLYSNFWQLSFIIRIQATISSILRLAFLSQKENLIQISTYSTNLWLLEQINYWDVDIIPEDWHVYLQAFFKFGNKVKTLPLYTIVNSDAVNSGAIWKTLVNRYEQEKRWAWGASDIAYTIRQSFTAPHIPWQSKLKKILYLSENHLLWPTSFFILTISASIPPLINPLFKKTVLGFILPKLSGFILTLTTSMLLIYIYLDVQLRKKVKVATPLQSVPLLLIQWYFLPFVSFLLSSLPALESHTRLLFGKKITYKVTEKV